MAAHEWQDCTIGPFEVVFLTTAFVCELILVSAEANQDEHKLSEGIQLI